MTADVQPAESERRHELRRPVEMRAYAVPTGGDIHEIVISDLSYEGCRIAGKPPRRGDRLELRVVRLGIVQAEVRWSHKSEAGCRFVG
jgi:hypothetical protein